MFGRRRDLLEREAERLGALAVQGDLTIPQHLERLVQATVGAFGGLDVLVLNGGGPPAGPPSGLRPRASRRPWRSCSRRTWRSSGTHCRTSARAGADGYSRSSPPRCASRSRTSLSRTRSDPGVVGWLKTLARELGPDGITVNTIAPGRIDTERLRAVYGPDGPSPSDLEQVPAERLGTPGEIAAAAAFLASDRAAYVTGAVLPVDGGLTRGLL